MIREVLEVIAGVLVGFGAGAATVYAGGWHRGSSDDRS